MNCTRFLTALLAAAVFAVPARAVEGLAVPSLSRNPADQWKYILPERAPFIPKVAAVAPGQPFTVYYVLGQFARREGRVDVVADADLILPDGKVDALFRQQTVYRGPDDGNGGLLSALRTQMVMEPEDRPGEYRLTVRFHDRNDGSRGTAEAKFRLESLPERFPPADLKRDAALIANYYRNPVPERLPGLLEAALRERPELTRETQALYYGFGLLFRQNPQLWPELARIASAQESPGACFSAAFVVRMLGPEGAARLRPLLDPEAVAALEKTAGVPVAVAEVENSADLDRLWMEFCTSGQAGPVRRLVGELVRFRDALPPAEFKAKKEKGESTPADLVKVMNFLVGTAAKWSLGSNARQHPVVMFYLEAMLKRGEIKDPHSAVLVEEILRKAAEPAAGPRK